MDYYTIHGHDVSSFDLPSTHRLPTVSAAQALQDLEGNTTNFIPTGLAALDASLSPRLDSVEQSGIQKGNVTEVWGPPGAGKTAFGLQVAAHCLEKRHRVVWVDGFHRVPLGRLRAVVGRATGEGKDADPSRLDGFIHYTCPTLPHLIALLCRPTASCIPQGTSLVVVDSLSALVNHAFPKLPEARPTRDANGRKEPSSSARRLQVLQYIISSLQKLAATRNLAILVLTQCATKMQAERGATLVPAINASVWEQGLSTRLVLFRDWLLDGSKTRGLRFVAIQKLNGKEVGALLKSVCAFQVDQTGLISLDCDHTRQSMTFTSTPARKRKIGDTNFEIADSEDEDYGWDDDDELPPMPSQWQGSEDLLLTRDPESDEEDNVDDEQSPQDCEAGGRPSVDDDTEIPGEAARPNYTGSP
ncbi:hypothetical protein MYCTH_2310088 [Thermothelomyces thermophilus ATCC 42464]|uniref:DNA repair protein RAD51 homolog 3 n=1 Tax=Thermothelomyces thermophilus (strain ATCC 42464 / BCRC 31852 / DSM 1799) TaxID=573729 RepID=G2QL15_THET4|nr:uncharacterized protein MYCTH_2310088 [Thermothelomyces thermophilus ATCC 42464]AEO60647.1 hypothetical protein MYCTH_2310088 [Thermothelomyces thermophilus ATCC 42464]